MKTYISLALIIVSGLLGVTSNVEPWSPMFLDQFTYLNVQTFDMTGKQKKMMQKEWNSFG